MLCVSKRLALKTKNADRSLLLSAFFVCYLVVVRVQSLSQREIIHFISTILTLEISPLETAKTPIKSGFSGTISFLLSFAGAGSGGRTRTVSLPLDFELFASHGIQTNSTPYGGR